MWFTIVPKKFETRTEIKNTTNLRESNQPSNVQTNLRSIKVVTDNKSRADNPNNLNTVQTIITTTKVTETNIEKPAKIYVKRPIKTSEETNNNSSVGSPTNKIIEVQIFKKEVVGDVSNSERKQFSNVELSSNLKKRDSIRNKYKFG